MSEPVIFKPLKNDAESVMALTEGFLGGYPAKAYGVAAANTAAANKAALQALIDTLTAAGGGTIILTEPIEITSGIQLKKSVKLQGNNDSCFKAPPTRANGAEAAGAIPYGAAFIIRDSVASAVTLYDNTRIDSLFFYYPDQNYAAADLSGIVQYPATITKINGCQSISLTRLTFLGEFSSIELLGDSVQDVEVDLCYAYPFGGNFLKFDRCYDIPRITRCHINPGMGNLLIANQPNTVAIGAGVINHVTTLGQPTFFLDYVEQFLLDMCFGFGVKTLVFVSKGFGSITNCATDQSETAFLIEMQYQTERTSIANCLMIAGCGTRAGRNGIVFRGQGTLQVSNTTAMVGINGFVPSYNLGGLGYNAFVRIEGAGDKALLMTGCHVARSDGAQVDHFVDDASTGNTKIQYIACNTEGVDSGSVLDGSISRTEIDELRLTAATKTANRTITPNKTVAVKIDGLIYKIPALRGTYLFEDQFTDTNGTDLTAHTPTNGNMWSGASGHFTIQSNAARNVGTDFWVTDTDMDSADGVLECQLTCATTAAIGMLRFRSGWRLQWNVGANIVLIRPAGSVVSVITMTAVTPGTPLTLKVVLNGVSIKTYVNGVLAHDILEGTNYRETIHGFGALDGQVDFNWLTFTDVLP